MKPARGKKLPSASARPSGESATADFLTIGWMLAVMTAFLCELGAVVALLAGLAWPGLPWISLLSGVLLFAALVVGLAGVALIPAVLRARKVPPPTPITRFAIAVAAAPPVIMIIRAFL